MKQVGIRSLKHVAKNKLIRQGQQTQQLFCVQAKYCVQINGTQEIQNQPLCSVQAKYCELNDE